MMMMMMMIMAKCLSLHHLIVLLLIVDTAECKECKSVDPVTAVQNSAVTLTCPVSSSPNETSQVFWQEVYGERLNNITQCPSSCTSSSGHERPPLCERVRTVQDPATGAVTLTISPVHILDALWYRCTGKDVHRNYCSERRLNVKEEPPVHDLTKGCKTIGLFEATVNSTFTFTYSAPAPHPNATQIIWGISEGDQTVPITRCPPCRTQRPLCVRFKTEEDVASGKASLTISPVEATDSLWFYFSVNPSSCYSFKLNVKDNISQTDTDIFSNIYTMTTTISTDFTQGGSHTTPTTPKPENKNITVIVAVTLTVFACIFVALVVGLLKSRLCVLKQKIEDTCVIRTECQYEAYAEIIDDEYGYSLASLPEGMCTYKDQ